MLFLRIDYIFADPAWDVAHFAVLPGQDSDHYPIRATVQ